ncbi:MAG: CopG family transcriptional regulator [Acidimicrobiia bacterium]|nr:CopG family transcriptional regulator [Acidimicrobiia bacterium]
MAENAYGRTPSGKLLTAELIGRLSEQAEEGFDVDEILYRRGCRPPMSSAAAATVESVRLDPELSPELSQALRERAGQAGRRAERSQRSGKTLPDQVL